jgi:hypothetical protein
VLCCAVLCCVLCCAIFVSYLQVRLGMVWCAVLHGLCTLDWDSCSQVRLEVVPVMCCRDLGGAVSCCAVLLCSGQVPLGVAAHSLFAVCCAAVVQSCSGGGAGGVGWQFLELRVHWL